MGKLLILAISEFLKATGTTLEQLVKCLEKGKTVKLNLSVLQGFFSILENGYMNLSNRFHVFLFKTLQHMNILSIKIVWLKVFSLKKTFRCRGKSSWKADWYATSSSEESNVNS